LTQKEPKKSRLIFFFTLLKLKNGYQNALVYLSSVGKLKHHFVNACLPSGRLILYVFSTKRRNVGIKIKPLVFCF
jgi:hypothetical protein